MVAWFVVLANPCTFCDTFACSCCGCCQQETKLSTKQLNSGPENLLKNRLCAKGPPSTRFGSVRSQFTGERKKGKACKEVVNAKICNGNPELPIKFPAGHQKLEPRFVQNQTQPQVRRKMHCAETESRLSDIVAANGM